MRRCTECGAGLPPATLQMVPYLEGLGLEIQVEASVYTCAVCGEVFEGFTQVPALHQTIANHIAARPGALRGVEIRFLREHLGLSGGDLADLMGVDPATVSRWQSEKQNMSLSHERLLRLLARLGPQVAQYHPTPSPDWSPRVRLRNDAGEWRPQDTEHPL